MTSQFIIKIVSIEKETYWSEESDVRIHQEKTGKEDLNSHL